MKKQVLGFFAIIILSATAITATKSNSVIAANENYTIGADTTPHRMYSKKHHDSTGRNKMDTSMNNNMNSPMHDSTHRK